MTIQGAELLSADLKDCDEIRMGGLFRAHSSPQTHVSISRRGRADMCMQLAMSQRRKSITGIVTPALSWLSLLSDTDPSCHWCVKMGDESRCQVQQSYTQQLRQSRTVQQAHEEGLAIITTVK